ncbi:hypothetical protein BaRGS_00029137 [Batillaria attramentaria]|uniref:GIPC GH2 domain-containing protein n=1 Tax=Batillaria attramentaria TaxID=370345 RepID=A0ABD0JXF7_9CAEN
MLEEKPASPVILGRISPQEVQTKSALKSKGAITMILSTAECTLAFLSLFTPSDVVLDCDYWYGTSPNCITIKPGYEYDNKVSDQLTVIIPIVTLQQAGKYICQVVGSDTSDLKACVLVVHNVSYTVNNTSQGLEEKKESQSSGSRNTAGTTPGAIVAAVLTAVVMVTVIIVIVVVILRRRGIICRSVQQKPPGKHTEGAASMYLSEDNIPEDVKDRAIQEIDRLVNFDFHGGSDGTLAREVWDIGRSKTNSYDLWQELEENGMRQFIDEGRAADIWGVISDAKRKPLQKDPKFR